MLSPLPKFTQNEGSHIMCRKSKTTSRWLRGAAALFFWLTAASTVLRVVLEFSPSLAEGFYRYFTRHIQGFMGIITSALPFSLAETAIMLLPFAVLAVLWYGILAIVRRDKKRGWSTLCVVIIIAGYTSTTYLLGLSTLYCRPSLSHLSGIENSPVSAEVLGTALDLAATEIEKSRKSESLTVSKDGGTVCPYGFDELSDKIEEAYGRYAEKNSWLSTYRANAKQIALSDYMTYTHISGIYTPYTGEANINVNYPDFIVVSTMAHEKAHQKGIAPENEANVLAMIVLCESGDPYLEYCGYMSVYSELLSAYFVADYDGYVSHIRTKLPPIVLGEFQAYSAFFDRYREATASKVADSVNDAYLRANGEVHGTRSYGMVVDMGARYLASRAEKLKSAG